MDFDDAGKTLTNDPSQTCADLCADLDGPLAQYKELVASLCPVTCGTCAGFCEDDEKPLSEWALTNPGFPQTCAEAPLCSACDNGNQGGVCLMKVDPASCPSNPEAYQPTTCTAANVAVGGMCEADGESGTDIHLDNCGGGYDMYKRVACTETPPPAYAAANLVLRRPDICRPDLQLDLRGLDDYGLECRRVPGLLARRRTLHSQRRASVPSLQRRADKTGLRAVRDGRVRPDDRGRQNLLLLCGAHE